MRLIMLSMLSFFSPLRALIVALMLTLTIAPAHAFTLPKPKLIAVYFTADFCPNCKILSPLLAQARDTGGLDSKDVLFVTLDLTNPASIHQSILQASALGITPFVQAQGSATGYVALLAADKATELARFDRTTTAAQIVTSIEGALAGQLSAPAK
jgi:thiol-disulfide isomerase/thioredoxin